MSAVDPNESKELAGPENAYNEAVGSAKLEQVMLTRSRFEAKPEFFASSDEEKKFIREDGIKSFSLSSDGTICAAEIEYTVQIKKSNMILLRVDAAYLIVFKFDESVSDDAARKVVSRVGRYAGYPYFRQHVAQKSWESSADLPILPIIKQTHEFNKG